MNFVQRIFHRPFFIRLFNWEYWSFNAVYIWIYPIWVFLCIRARSFFFFSAANPRIVNGGFLNESKKDIHDMLPRRLYPKTIHFSLPSNPDFVIQQLQEKGLSFPLIGKPDVGGRGRGVKALKNENDVRNYVKNCFLDFHIQEYVAYKNEVGIFYHRYPGESMGKLTGIVKKEFLTVTGDGRRSIRELLKSDRRAIMYLGSMENIHGSGLDTVLPENEKRIVSPYGNHARGSKFLDDSKLIDEELTAMVDGICRQIPEFYYGRMDVRYNTWEELKQGKNFTIIEVNGAGSEPTHMYDPDHSLFFAWKEIVRHWVILWRISRMNHKRGHRYLTVKEGLQMFREDKMYAQKLAAMPE
ncbi:MAG: hypothetical protein SFU87_19175 [Chitinophagaceae bacterium]|nr:hypothetical protein [Chitinophagaceae bacterium]